MPIPLERSPIAPRRHLLREMVEERIRSAILGGTLAPGELLHDAELQDWLGVSRTPIRDALNELARAGLVEMEPNRYTRVAAVCAADDALDALQAFGVLLGGVMRLAVPRMGEKDRRKVSREIERIRDGLFGGEPGTARDRAYEICDLVAELARNEHLLHMYRGASAGFFHKLPVEVFLQQAEPSVLQGHLDALADAVRDGDGVAAELAVEEMYRVPR